MKSSYQKKVDELKKNEDERNWYLEKAKIGVVSDELLKTKLREIEQKIGLLKIDIAETGDKELNINGLLNYAVQFIQTVEQAWYDALPEDKVKLQRLVFPNGVSYKKRVFSNQELGLPFEAIGQFAIASSKNVDIHGLISNQSISLFVETVKSWQPVLANISI